MVRVSGFPEPLLEAARLAGWSRQSELQDLEFSLLGFSLALVQYFLTTPLFLPFGMAMYVLCLRMLEVCNLL